MDKMKESRVWRAFAAGHLAAMGYRTAYQDWYGLESYIEQCRKHWVDLHWGWGVAICAVGLAMLVRARLQEMWEVRE